MTKRKSSKSLREIFASKNSKDRQRLYDNFLLSFPELVNYVSNFNSHKKYLLLQGATHKNVDIIAETLFYETVKHGGYDFLSTRQVDCSTSTYKQIHQMIFEDTKEDMVQIEILLKGYLLSLINHKQGSYKYPEMEYRIEKTGHSRSGSFTEKGLEKLNGLTGNILKKESISLPKDIYVNVMKRLFGSFFDSCSFVKFKAVGLVNVSKDDRIELDIETDRPDIVIATLKEGESVGNLSPAFRDGNLFEFVSLDGEGAGVKHAKDVTEPEVGFKGKQQKGEVGNAGSKTERMRGITKKRGHKPKHTKYNDFIGVLNDILKDDKNSSLGGYVIKVKSEMERKGLKDEKKKSGLIYEDSTISTYIQDHSEYKKMQKRKERRNKV